jgi:hypothetical protein
MIQFHIPTQGQVFSSGNTEEEAKANALEFYGHLPNIEVQQCVEMGVAELTTHIQETYNDLVQETQERLPGEFPTFH